jgi:hypothetical protein
VWILPRQHCGGVFYNSTYMAELALWLDHYDDIYSDFDSRYYMKRRISEDFLHEIKTAFEHKTEYIDTLLLILPAGKRQEESEKIIIASLSAFFTAEYRLWHDKLYHKRMNGLLLLAAGMIIMVINTFLIHSVAPSFLFVSLRVVLEPAGWFLLWTGMDGLFYEVRDTKKQKRFFHALADISIHFRSA